MIIAGYEYRGEKPFTNVYLTGIVRDKQRRKMSKSLGNSPDPLDLIDQYGADGIRVGMLLSSPAGNDLMFDEDLCKQGSAFVNKIFNASRLILGWEVDQSIKQPQSSSVAIQWYRSKFQKALVELENNYEKYRISDALMTTYKLIYDDFCGWLLEMVKPAYQKPIDSKTYKEIVSILEDNLKILHPFVPFISEEIWQQITKRTPEEALIINTWPAQISEHTDIVTKFEIPAEVISGIRSIRKEKNIAFKDAVDFFVINNEKVDPVFDSIIIKMGNLSSLTYVEEKVDGALSFRVKSNEYFIPISGAIDIEEEVKKLTEELVYTQGFLKSVQKKLQNERFVNNAPEQVIANERKKQADAEAKIVTLKSSLESLKK